MSKMHHFMSNFCIMHKARASRPPVQFSSLKLPSFFNRSFNETRWEPCLSIFCVLFSPLHYVCNKKHSDTNMSSSTNSFICLIIGKVGGVASCGYLTAG